MEYTKGDWKVLDETPNRSRVMVVDGKGRFSVYALYGTFVSNDILPVEEAVANAHLISASPDLYEACKEAYLCLEILHQEHPFTHTVFSNLWQAIAKAEGKS